MSGSDIQSNSASWLMYVKTSFAISLVAMATSIVFMPGSFETKAYLAICALFMLSSTITISKTMRDEHESKRLMNKISDAKTQQIIKEYSE